MLRALSGVNAPVLPLPSLRASLTSWKETGRELSLLLPSPFFSPAPWATTGGGRGTCLLLLTGCSPTLTHCWHSVPEPSSSKLCWLLIESWSIGRFGDWFHHNKNLKFEKPSKSLWKSGYTFCLISPSSRELPTSQGACCFLSFVPPASFPLFLPFFLSLF